MKIVEEINAEAKMIYDKIFDQEPINYVEAAGLYGIISQGRLNISTLEVLYNHARDAELRELIKAAIEQQTGVVIEKSENFLENSGGSLPELNFIKRKLYDKPLDIPADARYTDHEIVLLLATMAKIAQLALLFSMHNSYQPQIANFYRKHLESAFNFNYRLLQFALKQGWLPLIAKIQH